MINADIVTALAGIVQASTLVKQLAWQGDLPHHEFQVCIESLFVTNPNQVLDVYGEISNLQLGLNNLVHLLSSNPANKDPEIARYTLSMIHLERLLKKEQRMLQQISQGIDKAKRQSETFSPTHDNVIANIAGIYTDTLSTLKFRIHVAGDVGFLNNAIAANKVRSLLLTGIRSAVLWRQIGGTRLQLIFGKKNIIKFAENILSKM